MTTTVSVARTLPVAGASVLLATTAVGLLLAAAFSDLGGVAFFAAYAGIGTYLAILRPGNSVAWLLLLTGWGLAVGTVTVRVPADELLAGDLDPLGAALAWANAVGWAFGLLGFLGITLVFPDGHLPGGRGHRPAQLALGAWIVLIAIQSFRPTISVTPTVTGGAIETPNPLAIAPDAGFWALVPDPTITYTAMFVVFMGGLWSLVLRYRRSVDVERLRYRWLVAAIVLTAAVTLTWAVTSIAFEIQSDLVWVAVVIAYLCVPVAIAVAVLRYRLFEIDRIVSRTVAYAVVTAIVGIVFGGGIVLLSTAFASFAQGQTIAVAGSTLLAYAIFQPVHRRVRHTVDRRFDRARIDGEATVAAFSARLSDEISVEAVTGDLLATARATVAPVSSFLWIRSGAARR